MGKFHDKLEYINLSVKKGDILDFHQFLELCFNSPLEVEVAKTIIDEIQSNGEAYLITLRRKYIRSKTNPGGLCSGGTLNKVWKAMLHSGMTSRRMRYNPVKLSTQFSTRLTHVGEYWGKWIGQSKAS